MSRPAPPLFLAVLLVLAGCVAGPFAPGVDRSAPVELGNTAAETYRFEVSLSTIGSNLTVHRQDGTAREVDLTVASFGVRSTPGNHIVGVDLPADTSRYGNYTLAPGERTEFVVGTVRQDQSLVVVVVESSTGTVHSVHGANCRPVYFTVFELVVRSGGTAENQTESAFAADVTSSCGG